MPKQVRTFIAIEISEPLRRRITQVQRELAAVAGDVKWVAAEQMHLTLKFLGDVDERSLHRVCRVGQASVAECAPFWLRLASLGCFPNAHRPRVIWAGVSQGVADLSAIRDALEEHYANEGFAREKHGFTPHLTLGRVRAIRENQLLEAAVQKHQPWEAGAMQVRELRILSSMLTPQGPIYEVLARAKLAGTSQTAAS